MEENKIMEGTMEGVTNSKGKLIAKIAVGVLGAAAGIGAFIFYKKKKNATVEPEMIETNDENEIQ